MAIAACGSALQAQNAAPRHEVSASFQGLGLGSTPFNGTTSWNDQPGLSLGFNLGYTYWFSTHFGVRSGVRVNLLSHNQEISNFNMPFSSSLPLSSLGLPGGSGMTTVNLSATATSVQEEQQYTFVEIPLLLAMRFNQVYVNLGLSLAKALNATADYSYTDPTCAVTVLPDLGITPATPVPMTLDGETEGSVKNRNMEKPFYVPLAAEVGYNIPVGDVTNISVGIFGRFAPISYKTDNAVEAFATQPDATYQVVQPSTSTMAEKRGYYEVGLNLGVNFGIERQRSRTPCESDLTHVESKAASTEAETAAMNAAREQAEKELAAIKALREQAAKELASVEAARSKAENDLAEYRKSLAEQKASRVEPKETPRPAQKQPAAVALTPDTMILFYFDYDVTRPIHDESSENQLRNLCDAMQKDENIRVVVTGHTDNVGTKRNNLTIGRRRAAAVRRMMTEMGAPAQNITVATCGEREPVEPNDTKEGRAKNRRVTVKFK